VGSTAPHILIESRKIWDTTTSIERKLRMLQLQGIKGEAVIIYCEPLITQKMGYHRLSRRVNKMKIKNDIYTSSIEEIKTKIKRAISLSLM
jgi:hypothetical protein